MGVPVVPGHVNGTGAGRGGYRPGAGRPEGAATKTIRSKTQQYLRDGGDQPIDVMIRNMRWWANEADMLTERLQSWIQQAREMPVVDPEALQELLKLMNKVGFARDKAQECAISAAPYMHPRLQAIALQASSKDGPVKFTMAIGTGVKGDGEDGDVSVVPTPAANGHDGG
jgi:hypothetical protein